MDELSNTEINKIIRNNIEITNEIEKLTKRLNYLYSKLINIRIDNGGNLCQENMSLEIGNDLINDKYNNKIIKESVMESISDKKNPEVSEFNHSNIANRRKNMDIDTSKIHIKNPCKNTDFIYMESF